MAFDCNGLEILSRRECLALLGGRSVGRVAVSRSALPAILPVRYQVRRDDVVFAAGSHSKHRAVLHGNVIAFEVDDYDPSSRAGWSILAIGVVRLIHDDDAALQPLDCNLGPWVRQGDGALFCLHTDRLSGRRLLGDRTAIKERSDILVP